jgi:Holliday junction resolvase RusA-like endonuclease
MKYIIPWRIPSKKNSKQVFRNRLFPSKNYIAWQKEMMQYLQDEYGQLRTYDSCEIKMTIFFPDRRKSDLTNKAESIMDLLVDFWILKDDSHDVVYTLHLHSGWVDKKNPRAEIIILW